MSTDFLIAIAVGAVIASSIVELVAREPTPASNESAAAGRAVSETVTAGSAK